MTKYINVYTGMGKNHCPFKRGVEYTMQTELKSYDEAVAEIIDFDMLDEYAFSISIDDDNNTAHVDLRVDVDLRSRGES